MKHKEKQAISSVCKECHCEWTTIIDYLPAFKDAEPKCPCCDGSEQA
jgi:hypothetical protein